MGRSWWRPWWLPMFAALASVWGDAWYPAGDMAQAALHVRGFWFNPPLVGAAGRIVSDTGVQGSHPGPSLWVALYPIYRLSGWSSHGLMASVVVVHTAAIGVALALARRRGGTLLMVLTAATLAAVVRSAGVAFAIEPWNPWLAVLPFAVLVLALWSVLDGDRWGWPIAALAGWHCVQCHAGYLVVVVALFAAVGIVDIVSWVRRTSRPDRWLGLAVAVTALLWLPPAIDQIKRSPGNVSILYQHFVSPTEATIGLGASARIVGTQLNLLGPWLRGSDTLSVNPVGLVGFVALWGAAVAVAWRRRSHSLLRAHGVLAVASLAGALSVTRIFGGYFEYTVRWLWIVTALVVAVSVRTLVDGLGPARPAISARFGVLVSAAGAFGGAVIALLGAVHGYRSAVVPGESDSMIVEALAPTVAEQLAAFDPQGRYLIRWRDSSGLGATAFGTLLELEDRGFTVGVDLGSAAAALPGRVIPEQTATAVLQIVTGTQVDSTFRDESVIAFYEPRSSVQFERYLELTATLREWALVNGRDDLLNTIDGGGGSLVFVTPPLPADIGAVALELQRMPQPSIVRLLPVPSDEG